MAAAIREGRPHRASGALALHVLEVMEGFGAVGGDAGASSRSRPVPERPAPLADDAPLA